jgi:bis(5'-nucleosidyl)-tetraphosphatase
VTTKSTSPRGAEEECSAGFVVYSDGPSGRRYLLLKHRNGGHWAFPKGRIEPGETPVVAARREVAEETGIEGLRIAEGFRVESRYSFLRDGRSVRKRVIYYLAAAGDDEVTLSGEHSGSVWLTGEDAAERLTYDEARETLASAERYLEGAGVERIP